MERLKGLDAAFLAAENATNHMHTMAALVLDPSTVPGEYSFETARDFIARRLHLCPPLRRRAAEVPFGLHQPVWIEDAGFDLNAHLHHAALPAPGGRAELAEFVALAAERKLDRSRPLWEMHVVEGLEDGRVAVVAKLHHAMMDGIAGMGLLASLISFEPDAPDPDPEEWTPEPNPPPQRLLADALVDRMRPGTVLGVVAGTARTVAGRLRRTGAGSAAAPEDENGAAPSTPMFSAPATPLDRPLTARRAVAFTSLPLDAVKDAGRKLGATLNDVVVALVGGAARTYLAAMDALPEEPLVAIVPVSLHSGGHQANALSLMLVPTGTNVDDPRERLEIVHAACHRGKGRARQSSGGGNVLDWLDLGSPLLVGELARLYSRVLVPYMPPVCNMVISNVPGPPLPVYLAGAKVEALYPLGPVTDAMALNITVASCLGELDVGIMACPDRVPDLQSLADSIPPALDELVAAVDG